MKNVNLNMLFQKLIGDYRITNFNISSIIKENEKEPTDLLITAVVGSVLVDEIIYLVNSCLLENIPNIDIKIINGNLRIYLQFIDEKWVDLGERLPI